MNKIKWTTKAIKQAGKIKNPSERKAIYDGVDALVDFPAVSGVKKLTNHAIGYRMRVGNWRVLFDFDGSATVISIEEVKKRNERTY